MLKHRIHVVSDERATLLALVQKGKASAKVIQKAHVLPASDATVGRQSETAIAAAYQVSVRTVERIRREFCERGMALLEPQPRQPRSDKKVTGEVEAHLIALTCSSPPAGESRWKLRTLADRLVESGVVDSLSPTSVGTALKKTHSSPGASKAG